MYHIVLNRFFDPAVVWVDEPPEPVARHDDGSGTPWVLLALSTEEEARGVVEYVTELLDQGREAAVLFNPALVT